MESKCERCGLCCDGYTFWMTNRSYDDDPTEIKKLIQYHGIQPIKNAKGELGIHIDTPCIHFEMVDGKSSCKIQDNKPIVCKNYYCQKVKDKAETEKFVNHFKENINGIYL